jgi:hypothetical protein
MRGIHPPQLCKQLRRVTGIVLKVNTLVLTGLVLGLLTFFLEFRPRWRNSHVPIPHRWKSPLADFSNVGEELMITIKTSLLVLFFLCATAAFGQSVSFLNAEPQPLAFPSHPQHASRQPMGLEQNLLGDGAYGYTYARGERPLWDVVSESNAVPLGDVARVFKKEHATAKKADIVWTN